MRHAAGSRGLVRHEVALGLITGVTKISGNQRIDYGSFLSSPLPSLPAARPEARCLPSPTARLLAFLPSLIQADEGSFSFFSCDNHNLAAL